MDISRYVESAAYHEAGHAVVAAVQEMPFRHRGIHVDSTGQGITFYWYKLPDGKQNVGADVERERTIISTSAGLIAQRKFYPGCPDDGAVQDTDLIITLLNEMYVNRDAWFDARQQLWKRPRP